MAGLYIHIPFCRSKCIYCDFFSGSPRAAGWRSYAAAVAGELRERVRELDHIDTIYIGGGTPSLMPAVIFAGLMRNVCYILEKAGVPVSPDAEFTVEVNPDDICHAEPDNSEDSEGSEGSVCSDSSEGSEDRRSEPPDKISAEKIEAWLAAGVNRVSMGIQSFDDAELSSIGRRHTARQAIEAYRILSRHFGNISIDLMYGLPCQTPDSWRHTVSQAVSLRPQHISAYSLMYEEGTPLTVLRRLGRVRELPEETTLRMSEEMRRMLADAGYEQYEISNFSLPGYRSRHNSSYWSRRPYLGLGPSAHSYDGHRLRRADPPRIREYIARFAQTGQPGLPGTDRCRPFYTEERLTDAELMEEAIMLGLRTSEGISLTDYRNTFGRAAADRLLAKARPQIREGKLLYSGGHLRLAPQSIMISDTLILHLFDAI